MINQLLHFLAELSTKGNIPMERNSDHTPNLISIHNRSSICSDTQLFNGFTCVLAYKGNIATSKNMTDFSFSKILINIPPMNNIVSIVQINNCRLCIIKKLPQKEA